MDDTDLLYPDEINDPLIIVPDRVMDTIFTKYFKGLIWYEGIQWIDKYPMPRDVLREAVLNAVVHKDYSTGNPVHIKVYDDKVIIYNDCQLQANIPQERLLRGIEKMKKGCADDGLAAPDFEIAPSTFSVCFRIHNNNKMIAGESAEDEQILVPLGTGSGTTNGTANLDKDDIRLLKAISDNPAMTYDKLAVLVDMPRHTVSRRIDKLRKSVKIEHEGATKNGRWIVVHSFCLHS